MTFTMITVLFVLEASALEVPHWVQQKGSSFNSAPVQLQKFMAPFLSLQGKMQTPNSRRLQAVLSEECQAACPGVGDLLKEMMKPADDSLSDEEKDAAGAKLLCDNSDTVECMATNDACQDPPEEGEEPADPNAMSMFKCSCACASEIAMMEDSKEMCANKDKVLKCLTDNSVCSPLVKMLGGTRSADITCEMVALNCEELGGKLTECVGAAAMMTFGTNCSEAADAGKLADHKDLCCPILTDVMGCYKKKCVTLGWEMQEIMVANAKGEEKKAMEKDAAANYQWGAVCTDSGLPASSAELTSDSGGGGAASADDASHAVPVLGMLAMLIAASS
jgi:hypothetical protein